MRNTESDQACRDAVLPLFDGDLPAHVGLALNRYVERFKSAGSENYEAYRTEAYDEFTRIQRRDVPYRLARERWQKALKRKDTIWQFSGELASPLAIGLGLDVPMEVGMRLHHTYGTPLIPGSAIKGVCRQAARVWQQQANIEQTDFDAVEQGIFGDQTHSGACVFHDAWWEKSPNNVMVTRDTITVHHPLYYQGGKDTNEWPTDFDDPTPISFLVVPAGAKFQFALDIPLGWDELILDLVQWSLAEFGVGSKRNAGYGRFAKNWANVPRPKSETVTGWWYEPTGTGARIYADGDEANALILTAEQVARLTRTWTDAQRTDLALVQMTRKIEAGKNAEIVRLDWMEM